jgi:cardiolipin synthase C
MHNKLLVVDNSIALIGGRNIGDQYFQIDPESQFADDDVFAAGPIAQKLSATFDEFWSSALAIPAQAFFTGKSSSAALHEQREVLHEDTRQAKADGVDYVKRIASGEPYNGIISGRLPLVWAHAQVVCDSPDKRKVEKGEMIGRLMHRAVANATLAAQSELLMITPYLIPGDEGMRIFRNLRQRGIRVRVLTSSLESSTVSMAQAGYMHYRVPLLEDGVELYEIRSLLGNVRGSGQTAAISRFGNYSLHAKLFVFDRRRLFIGSMNFDQRSMHLNTEIGLIIDSPELAQQVAARFEAMVQPVNSYQLALSPKDRGQPSLVWRTVEDGRAVEYDEEPARSGWQRFKVNFLSLLPLDGEL